MEKKKRDNQKKAKNKKYNKIIAIIIIVIIILLPLFIGIMSKEKYTLESGAWVVGVNIPPGEYIITTESSTGGKVTILDDEGNIVDSEPLSSDGVYGVSQIKVDLETGYTVNNEIDGNIYLEETNILNMNSYEAGIWNVGEDIKPGNYTVTIPEGEMGTVVVKDKNGNTAYSATLDSNGVYGPQTVDINLLEGQTIEISGINEIKLN